MGLSIAAKEMLEYMAEHDDSRRVLALAAEALATASVEHLPPRVEEERSVAEEVETERGETESAQERAEEEEKETVLQEQLSSLYQEGVRQLEAEDWDAAIDAFQRVLALDSHYRDAASRLEEAEASKRFELEQAEAKKKAEEKRRRERRRSSVEERTRRREVAGRETAISKPSYRTAIVLHFLFGFGLFYLDRSLRRRWVYPAFPLYMTFDLAMATRGVELFESDFGMWTFFFAAALWGLSLIDVIWSCRSRRRASSEVVAFEA